MKKSFTFKNPHKRFSFYIILYRYLSITPLFEGERLIKVVALLEGENSGIKIPGNSLLMRAK